MPRSISGTGAGLVNVKVPPIDLAYDNCYHVWGPRDAWCFQACVRGCGGVLPPRWLSYPPELLEQDRAILDVILERVRGGATPRDACLSVGFSPGQWNSAMQSHTPAAQDFRRLIGQAQASARVDVAMTLKTTKPEMWALKGPGRKSASVDGEADTFGEEEKKLQVTSGITPMKNLEKVPEEALLAYLEDALTEETSED